jgi:hypothetical protein
MKCPNCDVPLMEVSTMSMCGTCNFMHYPNTRVIENIYAWVSVDKDTGFEGIIAMESGRGLAMPMVTSNKELMLRMEAVANNAVTPLGLAARLVEYKRVGIIK